MKVYILTTLLLKKDEKLNQQIIHAKDFAYLRATM